MLRVVVSDAGPDVLVEATGEVDMLGAPQLRAALREAVARAGAGTIVLDLARVDFLDSTGVQAMLDGYHAAMVAGGRLTLRGTQGTARRVLEVIGLTKVFGLTAN